MIPAEDAFLVADMLHAVVKEGTGWRLKELGRPLAGKTGTTNDQADAWFMGFSPGIATGVWVGHDESHFLGYGETGSRAAAPIWVNFMRAALADRPVRDFSAPSSIVWTRIDRETGLLASRNSKETAFQAFVAGSEPQVAAASLSRGLRHPGTPTSSNHGFGEPPDNRRSAGLIAGTRALAVKMRWHLTPPLIL